MKASRRALIVAALVACVTAACVGSTTIPDSSLVPGEPGYGVRVDNRTDRDVVVWSAADPEQRIRVPAQSRDVIVPLPEECAAGDVELLGQADGSEPMGVGASCAAADPTWVIYPDGSYDFRVRTD